MRRTGILGGALLLLLALSALTAGTWLWHARIDPASIPQSRLHRIGTTSERVTMAPLPSEHRVVLERVEPAELAQAARAYVPSWLGGLPDAAIQGYFDPKTGEIHITGELTRLQAMAPVPWLQGRFRHALRHEYGHAFLDEWLRDEGSEPAAIALVPQIAQREPAGVDSVPQQLDPVVREYREADGLVYDSSYFTSNFTEYFAESYARFLEGESVPPETRRFLDDASRPRGD